MTSKFENKKKWHVIGIMSGSSLDGLDVAYCILEKKKKWSYKIQFAKTYKYGSKIQKELLGLYKKNISFAQSYNVPFGKIIGSKVLQFINQYKIKKLDLVSSHGHTIFHQPKNNITLQIGCGQTIANTTNIQTINNFRQKDIKLGGEGAPLVPIGDQLLFSKYDTCINLGGFANISYIKKKKRIAYDICPCNIVLNLISHKVGMEYDKNGNVSREGKLIEKMLDKLNEIAFYEASPPKSLGIEWLNKEVVPQISRYKEYKNVLRTLVEHIAFQVSKQTTGYDLALLTGGGANNKFLISRINELSESKLIIPSKNLIEYKEALIFALLGVLKLRGENNILSSVTGAKKDHSSGDVYCPKN